MSHPEGYDKCGECKVCKLKKSLYGLKQTSRQWNIKFTSKLINGFLQLGHDHCLFTLTKFDCFLILLVYVNDVLITGDSEIEINRVKKFLDQNFTIKDLGSARYFLGLELGRFEDVIFVNQRKYVMNMLQDARMLGCKSAYTPLQKKKS